MNKQTDVSNLFLASALQWFLKSAFSNLEGEDGRAKILGELGGGFDREKRSNK